ncbi:MAG TPA: hypothetical protein VK153_00160 [Candidatus Paceibacterota bacterium]|nr:hypothetical protein [Candidatus Paceibacterota bacterium]
MKIIKSKSMKWWVGIISCVALFTVIMIFGYEKMSFVFKGVQIKATLTQTNDSPLATITGTAPKATYITLNGREIFIDKEGNFSESISVLPGFSIITLNAKDKFGKTAEKKFEVVAEKNAKAIAFNKLGSSD